MQAGAGQHLHLSGHCWHLPAALVTLSWDAAASWRCTTATWGKGNTSGHGSEHGLPRQIHATAWQLPLGPAPLLSPAEHCRAMPGETSRGSLAGARSPRPRWTVAASEEGEEMTFGFPGPRCSPWSGFWAALASCMCYKGPALHAVCCAMCHCLPPPPPPLSKDKLCLCTSLLLGWGRTEPWGWMCSPCSASSSGGSVPRGQALAWAEFPGLGPSIPEPLVSKEFPPAISERCVWKCCPAQLGRAGAHTHLQTLDRSCQDLPALGAVSSPQQLIPEICLHQALLSSGPRPSGRNSAFPVKVRPVGAGI